MELCTLMMAEVESVKLWIRNLAKGENLEMQCFRSGAGSSLQFGMPRGYLNLPNTRLSNPCREKHICLRLPRFEPCTTCTSTSSVTRPSSQAKEPVKEGSLMFEQSNKGVCKIVPVPLEPISVGSTTGPQRRLKTLQALFKARFTNPSPA